MVEGGKFDRKNDLQYPAEVSNFRLDKYEVTVGRFRTFVAATSGGWLPSSGSGKHAHVNDGKGLIASGGGGFETGWQSAWNTEVPATKADWNAVDALACSEAYKTWTLTKGTNESLPINCVDWPVAYAFCIWDGGFLPSATERDYAASGGKEQRLYPWGSDTPGMNTALAVYDCYFGGGAGSCTGLANIAPAGSVQAGAGRWGQLDLAGNVFEWTLDWNSPGSAECVDCAILTESTNHVRVGGSFASATSWLQNFSTGGVYTITPKPYEYGFRCARTP